QTPGNSDRGGARCAPDRRDGGFQANPAVSSPGAAARGTLTRRRAFGHRRQRPRGDRRRDRCREDGRCRGAEFSRDAAVLAARHTPIVMERIAAVRLPSMFQWPETVEAGALAGYGPRFAEMYRQRARMVARILRGANPADTPVEQPARFQLK